MHALLSRSLTMEATVLLGLVGAPSFAENPDLFQLNIGESVTDSFGGNGSHTVMVRGVQDFSERGHWQGDWRDILYQSLVTVEVSGVQGVVGVGPFHMPKVINGLRLGGELTKAFSDSSAIPLMAKDVQLTAKDAALPWYEPGTFAFPIKDYRWGASSFHNAWLGFHDMSGKGKPYYHHGVDFGGLHPDHVPLVSMTDQATISKWGVGTRLTNENLGLSIRYYHMDPSFLRADLGDGSVLSRGERFGHIGNIGTGNDAHVHIDARYTAGDQPINIHPLLVQAYLETHQEPIAFPGHKRHATVNRAIELDGSNSVAPDGRAIVSYLWQFTDGTTAATPTVTRTYTKRGTYSEELTVTDSQGAKSTNSVMVFVYDPDVAEDALYMETFNHWPMRGIRAGEPVIINFHCRNATSDFRLDYGDGTVDAVGVGGEVTHTWTKPGEYTLTYTAAGAGGTGIFKRRVLVVAEPSRAALPAAVGLAP